MVFLLLFARKPLPGDGSRNDTKWGRRMGHLPSADRARSVGRLEIGNWNDFTKRKRARKSPSGTKKPTTTPPPPRRQSDTTLFFSLPLQFTMRWNLKGRQAGRQARRCAHSSGGQTDGKAEEFVPLPFE